MRTLAGLAALAIMPALAGRIVRPMSNRSVAWAFGFLVLSLAFAVLHAARIPQAIAYAAIPVLAVAGALAGGRRPGAGPAPLPRLWTVLVSMLALCMALDTIWRPVDDWDAVAIWYARARGLLLWRPQAEFILPSYPNLGPAAWSLILALTGVELESIGRLVFPAVCAAWIGSLPLLFGHGGRRLGRPVLAGLFVVAVATFDLPASTSGSQDTLLGAVGGLAAILLGRALLGAGEPSREEIGLGFFFAGSLGFIKMEGTMLGAMIVATWIATLTATRGRTALRRAVPASSIVIYAGLALLWPVIATLTGVAFGQGFMFEDLSVHRFIEGGSRLPEIARAFAAISPTYSLVFLAAVAASVGAWRTAWTRPILGWLWTLAVVHTAWITAVFMLTNVDLAWHLRTALPRLVSQHAFVWVLALAVSVVALLNGRTDAPGRVP